jgi:hypothetical protein
VASTLLAVLYSAFTFYTRSINKEDRNLERSRRSQEILGLLREDCSRVSGDLSPSEVSSGALAAVGFDGAVNDFLALPRRGINLVSAYSGFGSPTPYAAHGYGYLEKMEIKGDPAALVYNSGVSSYGKDGPAENVRKAIPPKGSLGGILHVPVPFENPLVDFWLMRTANGSTTDVVLWSFHRKATARFPARSLTR